MPLSATLSAPLLRPNGHPIEFATLHPRDRIVHVLQEAERVHQAAHAFRALDLQRAGSLMTESYQSARTLYDISTPALDQMITAGLQAGAPSAGVSPAPGSAAAPSSYSPPAHSPLGKRRSLPTPQTQAHAGKPPPVHQHK